MQKNMLLLTMLCAVSMSGVIQAGGDQEKDKRTNVDTNNGTGNNDLTKAQIRTNANAIDITCDGGYGPLDQVVNKNIREISNHTKILAELMKPKFGYHTLTAASAITYGFKWIYLANPAWEAATALGGNVTMALSNTPLAGAYLKSAALASGSWVAKAAAIVTPWSGSIALGLFAAKVLWDCKSSAANFLVMERQYQNLLDKQKQDYINGTSLNIDVSDARFKAQYTATNKGVYGYIFKKALLENASAVLDKGYAVGVAMGTVIFGGMLVKIGELSKSGLLVQNNIKN